MSDPYLLAASLLTAGPLSVPPPPAPPPNLPNSLSASLASAIAETLQSVIIPKIAPIVEIISAEFSQPQSSPAEALTTPVLALGADREAVQQATNLQALPAPKFTAPLPTSGSQLYLQRIAALKAGKIYTRLPPDSFQSYWTKGIGTQAVALQQPTHEQWIRLLEQEAKAMTKGQGSNRLNVLVGDSLSMWFPSQRLPSGQLWLNQGISGENSRQILNRLSAFSQTRPTTIYVLAGINDLRQGASDAVLLDNLRQIVRRLRLNHPQSQIILQSILPTRLSAIPNERIHNLNQQITIIAQQEGTGYLNLHTLFVDSQGQLRQDLTTDGIHLTRQGYEVWQGALNYAEAIIATNRVNRK
jgi:lysophospholipase L1-like esterase